MRLALVAGVMLVGVLLGLRYRTASGREKPLPPALPKASPSLSHDFYLHDGDTVLFLGDSITEMRLYSTYVETYCVTRFPDRHFRFIHSGYSGDRVHVGTSGPIQHRIERDVLPYKPTVVTICLGMNDGNYAPLTPKIRDRFTRTYRRLLEMIRDGLPGVRITLLTPPAYDDVTRPPRFPGGYNAVLLEFGKIIQDLGREYGLTVADTNAPLVAALQAALKREPKTAQKILLDRVHPSSGGHLVIASALLRAWNAPAVVSDLALDAATGKVVRQQNTIISQVKRTKDRLAFTASSAALPWPLDRFQDTYGTTRLVFAVTDIEAALNHDHLRVTDLPSPSAELFAEGKRLGRFSHAEFAQGIDLAALPELPANRQAGQVLRWTRQHNDLYFKRWRRFLVNKYDSGPGSKVRTLPPDQERQLETLITQEETAVQQQQQAAQSSPCHYEIRFRP